MYSWNYWMYVWMWTFVASVLILGPIQFFTHHRAWQTDPYIPANVYDERRAQLREALAARWRRIIWIWHYPFFPVGLVLLNFLSIIPAALGAPETVIWSILGPLYFLVMPFFIFGGSRLLGVDATWPLGYWLLAVEDVVALIVADHQLHFVAAGAWHGVTIATHFFLAYLLWPVLTVAIIGGLVLFARYIVMTIREHGELREAAEAEMEQLDALEEIDPDGSDLDAALQRQADLG